MKHHLPLAHTHTHTRVTEAHCFCPSVWQEASAAHPAVPTGADHVRLGDWFLALVASSEVSVTVTPSVLPRQAQNSSHWCWVDLNMSTLLLLAASSAPTRALSKSQCSLKWSLPGSLGYCWVFSVPCSDIPCTTEQGTPSTGHFFCPNLCPLLLDISASLCHLCRVFCPDISIWPIPH